MQNRNNQPVIRADIHDGAINKHIGQVTKEFQQGFDFLKKYPKTVTIFGSARLGPDTDHYKEAEALAAKIVRELGYAVMSGGGPGIMEATSKGASEAGGASLGCLIALPHEHEHNKYLTDLVKFSYFFTRKVMLYFTAETYIFFPGGYGTMDELFGLMTLIQTGKIPKVPVILYGGKFWKNFNKFITENMLETNQTISIEDQALYEITDDPERVIEIIKKAPVTTWWKKIN